MKRPSDPSVGVWQSVLESQDKHKAKCILATVYVSSKPFESHVDAWIPELKTILAMRHLRIKR